MIERCAEFKPTVPPISASKAVRMKSDFNFIGSVSPCKSPEISNRFMKVSVFGAILMICASKAFPIRVSSSSGSIEMISSSGFFNSVVISSYFFATPFPEPELPKIIPLGVFNRLRSI